MEIGSCHFHRTVFKLPSLISFGQGRLGHTPPAEAEKAYYASIGNNDLAA